MQKYVLLTPKKTSVLEGLLAVKKSGLHEAVKMLKTAAQEFKSEYISNGEEEIDYSYLLNTWDFDEYESDDDVWIKYLKNQCVYRVALMLSM